MLLLSYDFLRKGSMAEDHGAPEARQLPGSGSEVYIKKESPMSKRPKKFVIVLDRIG